MVLDRNAILKADDLKTETVAVPEWGGEVSVRTLSGTERDAFEQSCFERNGKSVEYNMVNMRARLCVLCIVDDAGKVVFSAHDINMLGSKSGKALERVYEVAQRLSGLSKDDMDVLSKNSKADLSDDSTSDSPSS